MADFPETADGTLVVMVCRARHLPNRRKLDKQSPYVLLRINTVAQKTPAHFRAGQTPEWTHEIRFQLSRDRKAVMRLDVLDETKADPTPIGGTDIDCASVFLNPANLQESGKYILDGWHDLSFKDRYAGKIFLEMTFYPSAPMVPPKLVHSASALKLLPEAPDGPANDDLLRHLAPAAPTAPGTAAHDVFVSSPPRKQHFFHSAGPEPAPPDATVFVEGTRPKTSRLAKLKDKFMAKEPITGLWAHDAKPGPRRRSHGDSGESLMPAPTPLDNFEELLLEMGIYPPTEQNSNGASARLPLSSAPPPPPHSASGDVKSPERPANMQTASLPSPPKSRRKPPPGVTDHSPLPFLDTTNIPFSADNFQLDAGPSDLLPTKVFHMDRPVKSLTVLDTDRESHPVNPNEIDPRYYAPTPSEHLSSSSNWQNTPKRFEESATHDSGYLGEGSWSMPKNPKGKFSPSVFQRINLENAGEENKPPVPPKIPSGLSEKEYYVLDKDKYLKDINGRRF
ncbi:hypothetical protein METBIDRAFT_41191 [Metschnikowia bicuspidata var. bicuspidata NRRL YB-4993]|uniref:C2 domain-containing protein n=1 Tax=Metschnikowia bicuspidata var. bicuspidata NRRL YB-4993 TaxID=869754 RepID=A0A1A0HAV3_9ASCO|nr:hypothetical protein METBIDRAFT_41191 [Metschnikowia bicuspidata var. bicuspidata NRRL YB-4993]OBA21125.1 hypothetical protein METBIDRAFT_41191 [Metschnikowia bicuspidata var. bicuspidata NRRL YB-4993]